MAYSQAEFDFCLQNIKHGLRVDGRPTTELRSIEVSLGPIAQASGSARLRLGDTDVIVGVKAEVGGPSKSAPDCGRLQVTVECSPCASPEYEGRGGESWGGSLGAALQAALLPTTASVQGPASELIRSLCIIPGKAAWCLYVDCLVLNDAGGVLAALSMASLAALHATRLPRVTVTQSGEGEGEAGEGEPEIELDEDGGEGVPLQGLTSLPVVVSLSLLGSHLVVDPGLLEEQAAAATLHVAVGPGGSVCGVQQEGKQSLPSADMMAAIQTAAAVGPAVLSGITGYIGHHS